MALGGLLLFVSSLTLLEAELFAARGPLYLAAAASLLLAVGSLVADIRGRQRPTGSR